MNWWAARTALTIVSTSTEHFCNSFGILDASENRDFEAKEKICRGQDLPSIYYLKLNEALAPQDHRLCVRGTTQGTTIGDMAKASQGIKTGDDERFTRQFWEIDKLNGGWRLLQ